MVVRGCVVERDLDVDRGEDVGVAEGVGVLLWGRDWVCVSGDDLVSNGDWVLVELLDNETVDVDTACRGPTHSSIIIDISTNLVRVPPLLLLVM